jgi:hypothetical protein
LGALCLVIFLARSLLKLRKGAAPIRLLDTLLVFGMALLPSAAVTLNSLATQPDQALNRAGLGAAGLVVGCGLLVLLLEIIRKQRNLAQSRGLLGVGTGLLLALSVLIVPPGFAEANLQLIATSLEAAPQSDPAGAQSVFIHAFAGATGFPAEEVQGRITSGESFKKLITESGKETGLVAMRVKAELRQQIQQAATDGLITQDRYNRVNGSLDLAVAWALNDQLPPAVLQRLLNIGASQSDTTTVARVFPPTNTPAPSPTLTRTPRPTSTATSTPYLYASLTPTFTPAPLDPCPGKVSKNLNLRAAPDVNSARLLTIPYDSTVSIFARSADSLWLAVQYDNQKGWVSQDYVTPDASCSARIVQVTPGP